MGCRLGGLPCPLLMVADEIVTLCGHDAIGLDEVVSSEAPWEAVGVKPPPPREFVRLTRDGEGAMEDGLLAT